MRALILQYYERISASYWFIPSVMAIVAAILAFVLIELDGLVPNDALGSSPFLYATQPDGARAILSAIGGSMIGVAGTVFSVTMAAVVFASGSFGPRLLTNFMNDRGNQVTLGVFVATFVYSMLVLRSVRDGGDESVFGQMFVPNLAIFGAIILAIFSIGVLIYFIHHVPSNIHISNVIAGVGQGLLKRIDQEFPAEPNRSAEEDDNVRWQVPPCFRGEGDRKAGKRVAWERQEGSGDDGARPFGEIASDRTGYLQIIDRGSLIEAAKAADVVVRLTCSPGVFVHHGRTLFQVWPAERCGEDIRDRLLSSIAAGNSRSPRQDINFLFDELVEIAGRALSPGVNDPYTAITCLDWLKAAMAAIAARPPGDPYIVDADGRLRAIIEAGDFTSFIEIGFGHLRQYAASDMIAGQHFLTCLGELMPACRTEDQRRAVHLQASRFLDMSREALSGASLATVEAAAARVLATG
ncbi:DUF2254 domain-containing protein [Jiella avicenniae]|uniref:DUF2254 domain-containing protein n=1 Tax=Jiella avicenniae TaxID=2907202 RepID=A0A9X1T3Y9_9HYPH|nr:DUF2254 domain-containing protein [Jiella avicenniae]MCE7026770.1 DUF2254 domain-containing protein [Jiella avicenniae]